MGGLLAEHQLGRDLALSAARDAAN